MAQGKYDRQLIIEFLNGPHAEDRIIEKGGDALQAKARRSELASVAVKIRASAPDSVGKTHPVRRVLYDELRKLTGESRLYLTGHGGWPQQTMGGWNADQVATLLRECGFASPVQIISILACQGAHGPQRTGAPSDNALQSFAAKFHRTLGENEPEIRCDVYARVFNVGIQNDATLYASMKSRIGQKVTEKDRYREDPPEDQIQEVPVQGDFLYKQWHSKRRYFWDGEAQKWEWVDYAPKLTPAAPKSMPVPINYGTASDDLIDAELEQMLKEFS